MMAACRRALKRSKCYESWGMRNKKKLVCSACQEGKEGKKKKPKPVGVAWVTITGALLEASYMVSKTNNKSEEGKNE